MWNFGMNGLAMGPNYIQKRHYTRQPVSDLRVAPGKKFDNPNFVVNGFSKLASYSDINHQLDILNQSKNDNKNSSSGSSNIIEKIKEQCPELVEAPAKQPHDSMCKSAEQPKRTRASRKPQKSPHKSSKQNQKREMINDMLNIENETEQDLTGSLDLNEFVVTTKNNTNSEISREKDNSLSSSEDSFILFENEGSSCQIGRGSRQISVCESEDSFIIFEANEDCESDISSICSETEGEAEDEDDTTDLDSSYSVIEAKKVRFADDSQLCEVHPMVKWSYAYQAARKGPWEEYARDRERFQRRICDTESKLKHIFNRDFRNRIYVERFDCGKT